jgi:hypothetical protein
MTQGIPSRSQPIGASVGDLDPRPRRRRQEGVVGEQIGVGRGDDGGIVVAREGALQGGPNECPLRRLQRVGREAAKVVESGQRQLGEGHPITVRHCAAQPCPSRGTVRGRPRFPPGLLRQRHPDGRGVGRQPRQGRVVSEALRPPGPVRQVARKHGVDAGG